jgi:hypothetical protein
MGIRLGRVSYDGARGWFEARVDVDRDGRTFRDPARVAGPANAPRPWVGAALADHALRMSDSGRPRPF